MDDKFNQDRYFPEMVDKPNYKVAKGCGNCKHSLDLNHGNIYCAKDKLFPGVNAYIWPKWRDKNEVHACGVCDDWSALNRGLYRDYKEV
jgi:hypothetical protein